MERMLTCRRCGKEYPLSELRMDASGNWICRGCLAGLPVTDRSPVLRSSEEGVPRQRRAQGMVTYTCACGYAFRKRPDQLPRKCPYCGRDPASFKKEVSAQDLLDDAEE